MTARRTTARPRARGCARRAAALALLASIAPGCAPSQDAASRRRSAEYCYAPRAVVEDYLQRISDLVSNQARTDVLWRREQAYVSFDLEADGSANNFRIVRAPRPEVGEVILQAAMAAAPFPRPPFDPRACLYGGNVELWAVSFGRCDATRADEYTDVIAQEVQTAVAAAGLTAPAEPAQVTLRFKLDPAGAATFKVHDAPSVESGEQVAAIARKLSPFEAPADSIRECVADQSLFLWISLPGATRPPVRIAD